ncbi:hypothetical protein [Methylobacterium sp. NFXW15]|uniref:hypothetical protein n=1 Tax=Methylobacterium sp. NFXW15 TaxID=2819512 RepID=UPI003CEAA40E
MVRCDPCRVGNSTAACRLPMPQLQIISGAAGKGSATYEEGVLSLPNGDVWYAEQFADVAVLSGVDEKEHWSGRLVGGLRGGLSMASALDLSPTLSLAASLVGAGAESLAADPKSRAVIEITAQDRRTVVAIAAPGLAALMIHDRAVCLSARGQALEIPAIEAAGSDPARGLPGTFTDVAASATATASLLAGRTGQALSGLWPFAAKEIRDDEEKAPDPVIRG